MTPDLRRERGALGSDLVILAISCGVLLAQELARQLDAGYAITTASIGLQLQVAVFWTLMTLGVLTTLRVLVQAVSALSALVTVLPLVLILSAVLQTAAARLGASSWRGALVIGAIALAVLIRRNVQAQWASPRPIKVNSWIICFSCCAIVTSGASCLWSPRWPARVAPSEAPSFPNIILLSADGVEAAHLSLYGYARKTTPFLDSIASELLIPQRAFAPSSFTTASLASLYSGTGPLASGVTGPGREAGALLKRKNALAVLSDYGYRAVFDAGRFVSPELMGLITSGRGGERARPFRRFLAHWTEQALAMAPRPVANRFELWFSTVQPRTDQRRMADFLERVREAEQPFVAQIHLMDSHCCDYENLELSFGRGRPSRYPEAYDDVLLKIDGHLRALYRGLQEVGLLERSIVVFASDHSGGARRDSAQPVLLALRFPGRTPAGRLARDASLEDVMPTIFDVLGLGPLPLATGRSLLRAGGPAQPLIGSWRWHMREESRNRHNDVRDPRFGVERYSMVHCDRWYHIDPETLSILERGDLATKGAFCPPSVATDEDRSVIAAFRGELARQRQLGSTGPDEAAIPRTPPRL